jgi:mercuric ion binding protein
LATFAVFASSLLAATQIVTLSAPSMICAICPITVKKVLTKVSGVSKTDVNLDSHEAKEAVYPSTAAGSAK